jgi:RNA polymerase sigma-70 factor (ECF subfamily)
MTSITDPDAAEARLALLWQRASAGDEAAYREALRLAAVRLRGYFRRRMDADSSEVEDLVQETLLAVHLHRDTHDPTVPLGAWLQGIARHKLVDWWRRRGREASTFEPLEGIVEPAAEDGAEEAATRRDIVALLQHLPEAHRRAILDTKVTGLSLAESARRAGISVAAVKVHVHRGLKRLAALMQGGA